MEITFTSRKLAKTCNSKSNLDRAYGSECAEKVASRLQTLEAADSLADVMKVPQCRCHPLKGDRAGEFAVDVKHPFRLVFKPAHNPLPEKEDGGLDLTKVTSVEILRIEDYH